MKLVGLCALLLAPIARADDCPPEHAAMGHCVPESIGSTDNSDEDRVGIGARAAIVAASYESPLFEGNYQGATLGVNAAYRRFAMSVDFTTYQLTRNGLTTWGTGDVMVHLHAELWTRGSFATGVMLMTSLPTGDSDRGFGMGHVMVMPDAWATWTTSSIVLDAAIGGGYAFGGASAHAMHGGGGAWPLVDPMNARELAAELGATYSLSPRFGVGVRSTGAIPVGAGHARTTIGGRVSANLGRTITTLDVGAGISGDPYDVRATLGTTVRIR